MVDGAAEPEKTTSAGAQAAAALLLVGGLGVGLWALGNVVGETSAEAKPAVCSSSSSAPPRAQRVSGRQLCKALNRPDLAALLGTPTEQPMSANGNERSFALADGTKIITPEGSVDLDTYSVKLSASYDDISVARMSTLMGIDAEKKTFLGHPALLYSDRTIEFDFTLDGDKASTGPGGIARCLMVAPSAKDGGGSLEIVIWRQDNVTPDDAALLRVAERVLPTVPGWDSAG
ncbi:hypothetical protein AQJ30_34965 [Streptomyces longwoodensis]|uniref:Uncharacterized protein n=1 Tax=Streptomyces longwoodensis TaxID=68231 RepID=A0A101QNP9_9ACTN|nr:DUF6215 domain-containing protein [Streptomyces longwoodensis]KUN33199.1 hypothetical protein AQJ30_34965 [Streptomyces longwoodensis]